MHQAYSFFIITSYWSIKVYLALYYKDVILVLIHWIYTSLHLSDMLAIQDYLNFVINIASCTNPLDKSVRHISDVLGVLSDVYIVWLLL